MARTLVRPSLYDKDCVAWTEQQAALLRAGRLDQLDLDNLAEELDTMGRSESTELETRLEVLLMHMPKWTTSRRADPAVGRPPRASSATLFAASCGEARALKRDLEATIADVYRDAAGRAIDETGLSAATFPDQLPYSVAKVLEPEPTAWSHPPQAGRQG